MKQIVMIALLLFGPAFATAQTDGTTRSDEKSAPVPFSDFALNINVEENDFEVRGTFTLGPNSDGINLYKEDVAIKVGDFATTIPAGSFKQDGERTKIRYRGVVEKMDLDVV